MMMRRTVLLALLALPLLAGPTTAPFLRIEQPNGGETLQAGCEAQVRWLSVGVEGPVAILLFKGGEQHAVIAAAAPNIGFYRWLVPAALPGGGQYRLRICSLRDLRVNDFSDRDFAIKK
jgi:hypothetical protein